eukprot:gene12574-16862_t
MDDNKFGFSINHPPRGEKSLKQDRNNFFSRSDYMQKISEIEEIKCVIISTYRINLTQLKFEFLDEIPSVPLLLFHGDKNSIITQTNFPSQVCDTIIKQSPSINEKSNEYLYDTDEENEIKTHNNSNDKTDNSIKIIDNENEVKIQIISGMFTCLEVFPQEPNMSKTKTNDKNQSIIDSKAIMGVHHPKYVLLFTNKGLHVIISTANLTSTSSLDGTWNKFFPIKNDNHNTRAEIENDFGIILDDFIYQQAKQVRLSDLNHVKPEDIHDNSFNIFSWIKRHIHNQDFKNLSNSYDFSNPGVFLVSVVPGRDYINHNDKYEEDLYQAYNKDINLKSTNICHDCKNYNIKMRNEVHSLRNKINDDSSSSKKICRYGMVRMKQLLELNQDKLKRPLTSKDILLVQPTSIGGNINNHYIGTFLNHLMPETSWLTEYDNIRQESWKLIWPTKDYVRKGEQQSMREANNDYNQDSPHNESSSSSILFLHPRNLAMMEADIHSQMMLYESNYSSFFNEDSKKVPHIKSYMRVLYDDKFPILGNNNALNDEKECCYNLNCTCQELAWCLLSSACLSKGAFGDEIQSTICNSCNNVRQGYFEFKNFELGVLFHSDENVQYKALQNSCKIHNNTNNNNLFHPNLTAVNKIIKILPIPYEISALQPYCDGRGYFTHMPFFHEPGEVHKYSFLKAADNNGNKLLIKSKTVAHNEYKYNKSEVDLSNEHQMLLSDKTSSPIIGMKRSLTTAVHRSSLFKTSTTTDFILNHTKLNLNNANMRNELFQFEIISSKSEDVREDVSSMDLQNNNVNSMNPSCQRMQMEPIECSSDFLC